MTRPMSDEEIAKRCGLKVSDVRSVLNKLHEYGITAYIRERDKDTGWFSYNWTVNVIRLYDMLERKRATSERNDEEALSYEKSYTFYTCENAACPSAGQRVPETDAILTTYACGRCGEHLQLFDNTGIIKSIEEKLAARTPDDQTFVKEFRKTIIHSQPPARKRARMGPKRKSAPKVKTRAKRIVLRKSTRPARSIRAVKKSKPAHRHKPTKR